MSLTPTFQDDRLVTGHNLIESISVSSGPRFTALIHAKTFSDGFDRVFEYNSPVNDEDYAAGLLHHLFSQFAPRDKVTIRSREYPRSQTSRPPPAKQFVSKTPT